MNKDYYKTLGVSKSATAEEIKKAYRHLAMKHHPDKGGDQSKFKKINEAYQVLSNSQKRTQYDQFGASGVGAGFGNAGQAGGFRGGYYSDNSEDIFSGFSGFGHVNDIFEDFFGQAFSQVQVEIPIKLTQAILGCELEFEIQGGGKIKLKIPAGAQDGQSFKFRGKGRSYRRGRGDLIATVRVQIPKKISKEEKELYEKLRDLEQKKKSWKFW